MEIKTKNETKTAVVRATVPLRELPGVIGEAYGEIMAYFFRTGLSPTGFPFVLYGNDDMDALRVEMGFPVDREVKPEGRVEAGTIPGGEVLSEIHVGPYTELERTYTPVMKYIQEQGLAVTEWMYEIYLNSPEDTPETELRTEICFPLKR